MNLDNITLWGCLATVLFTAVIGVSEGLGLSRISLPFMVGTIFTSNRYRANAIGFLLHFLMGWAFALLYAVIFETWRLATWWNGGILGLVHGLIVLVAFMPLLPNIHPRMASEHQGPEPTRALEPPGFMALNYGRRTPMITLLAHLVFGLTVGAFYRLSAP